MVPTAENAAPGCSQAKKEALDILPARVREALRGLSRISSSFPAGSSKKSPERRTLQAGGLGSSRKHPRSKHPCYTPDKNPPPPQHGPTSPKPIRQPKSQQPKKPLKPKNNRDKNLRSLRPKPRTRPRLPSSGGAPHKAAHPRPFLQFSQVHGGCPPL